MAKKEMTEEQVELFRELTKLSKRANQRLVRLERVFGKDTWASRKLKNRLDFLEIVLISNWVIIIFNIVFSVYLLLTMFNKQEEEKTKVKESKTSNKKEEKKEEKFTAREKEFLNKKKIRTAADLLVEK